MNVLYLVKSSPIREYLFSKAIKELNGIDQVYACVFSKRNMIDIKKYQKEEQNFDKIFDYVEYAKNRKIEDVYYYNRSLEELEVKYNLPYNFALNCDRHLVNYREILWKFHLYTITVFIEELLNKFKIHLVIGELSSSSDIIAYYLCRCKNIGYLMMSHGRIPGKVAVENVFGERLGLKTKYNELKERSFTSEEKLILDKYLREFHSNHEPDYEKINKVKKVNMYAPSAIWKAMAYVLSYKDDLKYSVDFPIDLLTKITPRVNRILYPIKRTMFRRLYSVSNLDKDKFLLYPLHVQPEASTMTFAQLYLDQIGHIGNLAKSIPSGWYLYVKEHPSMVNNRKIRYIKKLSKINNVKVIDPHENTIELIKNSQGVITLTGTVGYEAIIYKKPVFVFGNVFYNIYNNCYKCNSYEDFIEHLEILREFEVNEHNLNAFILANYLTLMDGNLNFHLKDESVLSKINCDRIAEIVRKIG